MGDNDTTNPNTYTTTVSLDLAVIAEKAVGFMDIADAVSDALDMTEIADYVMDQMDGDCRVEGIVENLIDGADLVVSDDLGPAIDLALEDLIPEVSSERVQDIENDVTKLEEAVFGSNEEGCVVVTSRNLLEVLSDVLTDPAAATQVVGAFTVGIKALLVTNSRQAQTIKVLKEEVAVLKGNTPTPTE